MSAAPEEADGELRRWRDRLAAASRNVSELSELPEYSVARQAAAGAGRTADEARELTATMDELWQGVLLIGAALDRAEQARAAGSRLWGGEDAARRALDILRGASITVDLSDTPVLHRRLLAGPRATATVSPETLLETMDAAFDRARERLARITGSSASADALRAALAASVARLPAPEALSARLTALPPDPLDRLDALEALRPDVEAALASDERASAALAAARADLAALQDAASRAAAAVAACRAAVAIALEPLDEAPVRELAAWLDRIGRTRDAGRAEACMLGLSSWRAQHDASAAPIRAASAAAAAALARRDELRARLGALRAKRRARAGADPALEALEAAARDSTDAAPADLAAASAAVAAFQAALARS